MVDTTGATCMIDARAASWVERDITLGTGVYLAPERWRGDEITAAVDVYAATITFVEMLVGEPPYWEDSQLIALRFRHEQEEIPAERDPGRAARYRPSRPGQGLLPTGPRPSRCWSW